ncbi:MAG: cytochrome c oxidase assembly protein [Hyphomicrobiaceae bacterium]
MTVGDETGNAGERRTAAPAASASGRHAGVAAALALLAVGMVGMAYAAVPLYRLFCQVTGYGGTPRVANAGSDRVLDRTITVRFDANISRALPWEFEPVARTMQVRLGETSLAHYKARNEAQRTTKGSAVFNVTPESAGAYFNKIECFCFTEQTLAPGQSADMPVSFFVDPAIVDDPDAGKLSEITLSYTFYPLDGPAADAGGRKQVAVRGEN